ncbi:LysE family translocator [Paenibacillus mucilaginosus]|uniref:LysE family translocator n=1 Tax=Paenibacillus mucilaginosus TaxID=61624 RepID=UPI0002F2E983|nr:LysE family transporter [Paenibacillus mucilaginosus]
MELFLSGFLLSLALCLDLGMVNVTIMKTGVERGLVPAALVGFGSGIGDLIYAVLSMVGVTLILENIYIRWILWIGGTLILLHLTWQMIRSVIRAKEVDLGGGTQGSRRGSLKDLYTGMTLALASPTAILFFASIGGSVIASTTDSSSYESLMLFFLGFFVAGLVWSAFMAVISSQGAKLLGEKLTRGFSIVSAILFLFFAVKVFLDGYHTLL